MKKLIILVMMFISFTLFAQQPKKPFVDSSKLYKWGDKMLTKKKLRDTLRLYYNKFTTK
jgi:hypothetical protein